MNEADPLSPEDHPERPVKLLTRLALLTSVCVILSLGPHFAGTLSEPKAMGSVAADATVESIDTMGMASQVLRGGFPPDGALARQRKIVVFGSRGGSLELDLGREVPIAAILVQALSDDDYVVESASESGAWTRIWRVLPTTFDVGLYSRHHRFDDPPRARWLRLRNASGAHKVSAIRAIRVFSEVPDGWPDSVQPTSRESRSSYPWLDLYSVTIAKFVVAFAGAVWMVVLFMLDRFDASPAARLVVKRIFVALSLVAGLCWWNLFQYTTHHYGQSYANDWDVYHYYLGSKYAPELRYTNLYHCSVVADGEDGLGAIEDGNRLVRDLRTNQEVPVSVLRAASDSCKSAFSNARWSNFKRDVGWFRTRLPPDMWQKITLDHGYNPSPAWAILGRALTSTGPASSAQLQLLTSLDTVLLVLMWALLWHCFGWKATGAAIVFWGTNYTAGNWFTAGAFLRHDWLFLVVAGICALKRERMALAGFLLAYATLLRIFPAFFILGVLLKFGSDALAARAPVILPPLRRFVVGAALGGLAIVLSSFVANGRVTVWQEFVANTQKQHETMRDQNIGIEKVFAFLDTESPYRGSSAAEAPAVQRASHDVGRILFALAFLPLLFAAVRRQEPWVAAILGVGWLPFVTGLSNYYWAMFLVFALLVTRRPALLVGFALVTVAWSAMGLIYPLEIDHPWPPFGGESYSWPPLYQWSSLILIAFIVWATTSFALKSRALAPGLDASRPVVRRDMEGGDQEERD